MKKLTRITNLDADNTIVS